MMKKNIDISVSTDPVKDFQELVEYAKELQGQADLLHCDVMDGEFVNARTFDAGFVKNLNAQTITMLDVHLMVKEPLQEIEKYASAGANIITVHYEAFANKNDVLKTLKLIKEKGCLAGISFKPQTKVNEIKNYLYFVDLVLVMGVEPGASGQEILQNTYRKISELKKLRHENKYTYKIEVDGGVTDQNSKLLSEMGADILVSGSFVYNAKDRAKAIKKLKK